MNNYGLKTWSGDKLVGYEHFEANTIVEATAYASGMLTERTRDHGLTLARLGVHYQVEHGLKAAETQIGATPIQRLGTWHLIETQGSAELVWERFEAGGIPTPDIVQK